MATVDAGVFDLGYMDRLSRQDSPIHRLDPRAKLVTTLLFVVTVVSFHKYELSALTPFFLYPVFLSAVGRIPVRYLARKLVLVSPFAIMLGLFNPFLDTHILLRPMGVEISGGWVSFASILVRFVLTVGAALTLIAVTGFNSICAALGKLGVPKVFVVQLMFLYRYLFVLTEETVRLLRARSLRSFGGRGKGIGTYGPLAGHLLLRTLDRAQRIHLAMCARGFDGEVRVSQPLRFGLADLVFTVAWAVFFLGMRLFNPAATAGGLLAELLP